MAIPVADVGEKTFDAEGFEEMSDKLRLWDREVGLIIIE